MKNMYRMILKKRDASKDARRSNCCLKQENFSRRHLARGGASSPEAFLIAVGLDKIGLSDFSNQTVRFLQFRAAGSGSCLFHMTTYFGDSVRESTTSSMSSMKGENSDNNGSDLDKGNILKSTFNTLTEEGRKEFKAYHANFEELFISRCEVT
jgi:hypothetical protein